MDVVSICLEAYTQHHVPFHLLKGKNIMALVKTCIIPSQIHLLAKE